MSVLPPLLISRRSDWNIKAEILVLGQDVNRVSGLVYTQQELKVLNSAKSVLATELTFINKCGGASKCPSCFFVISTRNNNNTIILFRSFVHRANNMFF